MAGTSLPSRAKPEALYETCRNLDEEAIKRSDLYDDIEYDRRQVSAATDYGRKLGFIEYVDDEGQTPRIRLGRLGQPLHYADSMEESGVRNAFQRAIESYEPYRNGLLASFEKDCIEESDGERWLSKDDLQDEVDKYIDTGAESREINLFLKTAAAAGLGERKVGRRGFPTRLVVNSEFDDFMDDLSNRYTLPEPVKSPKTSGSEENKSIKETSINTDKESLDGGAVETDTADTQEMDSSTEAIVAKLRSSDLTLEIGLDISGKDDEEVLQIINKIESLE